MMLVVMTDACAVLDALNSYLVFKVRILLTNVLVATLPYTHSHHQLKGTHLSHGRQRRHCKIEMTRPPREMELTDTSCYVCSVQPPLIHVHTPRGCPKPLQTRTQNHPQIQNTTRPFVRLWVVKVVHSAAQDQRFVLNWSKLNATRWACCWPWDWLIN